MKKIVFLIALSLVFIQAQAQPANITGTVVDEEGSTLPGVNIRIKDKTIGTVTDMDGKYVLSAADGDILVFSFIGYKTLEKLVQGNRVLDVVMEPAVSELEEVVVVGYGEQKKASVVGAISSVRSDDLKQSASANLSNAIAGRISGVMTKMISGRPGADNSRIFIRGQATMNDATPLVMIDGVEGDFTQLDPDDIESFSVMKDASATAVYGVRGANGVILVTTKRGIKQKPVVSFSGLAAVQTPIRLPEVLDAYNFALLKNEAIRNDGGDITQYAYSTDEDLGHYRLGDAPFTHPDNDLIDRFLRKYVPQTQVNLNVRGGSDFLKYFVAVNYLYQDGIYAKSDNGRYSTNASYQRINLRSNLDFNVTKSTLVSIDLTSSFRSRNNIGLQNRFSGDSGPESNNMFELLLRQPANYMTLTNPDGSYGSGFVQPSGTGMRNPLQIIERGGYYHVNQNVYGANLRLNQKLDFITKGLSVNAMVKATLFQANSETLTERPFTIEYNKYGKYTNIFSPEELPQLSYSTLNDWIRIYSEASVNYAAEFGNHAVTALALYNQTSYVENAAVPTGYLGFVGRVTYGYKRKYLGEINLGYNGSDQFAKGQRYALFPAFSAGWVISEENFWKKHIKFMNYLKVRGSYGMVGNDKLGNNQYLYIQTYSAGNANFGNYNFGTTSQPLNGWLEGRLGNNHVTWERAEKTNIGADIRMFRNRLSLGVDYFYEYRKDILMVNSSLPSTLGIGVPPTNIGRVENRGGELEIGYNDQVKGFRYFAKGNVSYAKNTILFQGEPVQPYEWMAATGRSIGQFFGLRYDGLFMSPEDIERSPSQLGTVKIGDIKYKDLNDDGVVDKNYDKAAIGYGKVPRLQFGLTLGFEYRNFDFSMLWQGAALFSAYFEYGAIWEFLDNGNAQEHHLGRFNPEDPSTWEKATYPRLHNGYFENNHTISDYWLKKGDYLRLKNMEVGYTLPKKLSGKLGISNMRVYLSGTNLLTFDYVKTFDPETETTRGYNYPQLAQYTFGFNVQF